MSGTSIFSVKRLWIAIPVTNKDGVVVRHRKARLIRGPFKGVKSDVGSVSTYTFAVTKRQVSGDFVVKLDKATGNCTADADKLIVHHKLAKRKYVVIGYALDANITNTNRRAAAVEL